MTPTNLNPLFIDQVTTFAHLLTIEPKTREQFKQTVCEAYDTGNPKTALFCASIDRSEFDTIRLSDNRDSILFNQ